MRSEALQQHVAKAAATVTTLSPLAASATSGGSVYNDGANTDQSVRPATQHSPSSSPSSPSLSSQGTVGNQNNDRQNQSAAASSAPIATLPPPPPSPLQITGTSTLDGASTEPLPHSPFWYMEAFAKSLKEDSQLVPFDDIILLPNTRYPVSLRQSTHLAALAMLATRGLPHVHVDFTALEHPDESMPVVYDLICRYPNCAIVHWLHDAYEMQNWSRFADFKMTVPIMLLQTTSFPLRALEQIRPPESASLLHSTQYHAPDAPCVRTAEEAEYYRRTQVYRREVSSCLQDRQIVCAEAEGSAAAAPSRDWEMVGSKEVQCSVPHKGPRPRVDGGESNATAPLQRKTCETLQEKRVCLPRRSSKYEALRYTDCVRGRWWRTRGGRGDDEVEVSRSYLNSASSSWLGGASSASPTLPDLNEEELAVISNGQEGHFPSEAALREATRPSSLLGDIHSTSSLGLEEAGGAPKATYNGDAVVSDDGFTIPLIGSGGASHHGVASESSRSHLLASHAGASRETADETTRERLLNREIAEVREDLRRMLRYSPSQSRSSFRGTTKAASGAVGGHGGAGSSSPWPSSDGSRGHWSSWLHALRGFGVTMRHDDDLHPQQAGRRRDRTVRQLLEELYPRHSGPASVQTSPVNSSRSASLQDSTWLLDAPLVEVHPITRCTGADVRQALWEQYIHPSSILPDFINRYVESHGLYRDSRKATASQRGGSCNDFGGVGAPVMTQGGSAGGNFVSSGSRSAGTRRVVALRDTATLSFPGLIPRLELHYDRSNLLAREQYEKLRVFQRQDGEEPDLIVPIGGDGYMMHCIRKNWRRFIPFYGVNAGHVGYLLNDRSTLEELFSSPLKLHFTTMLYCQAEKESDTGERVLLSELAFNDAWVERSSGQTALIRILVNGQERIRRLRGDGVLVSTAAGSTAYSQALGASPVPVGAPLIQVVGSNVVSPAQWRPAHLDQEDQVEFEVVDSTKRPCRCYVDSVDVGNVTRMLVRSSRVAGVTLAFSKSCDLQHKLYQMQFPKTL